MTLRFYIPYASCLYEVIFTNSRLDYIRQTLSDGHTTTRLSYSDLPLEVKEKLLKKLKRHGKTTKMLGK